MTADSKAAARGLEAQLRALGRPERADRERAYLRSDLEFLGVSVPDVRAAAKRLRAEHPGLDHAGLVSVVEILWERGIHECRVAAVELLGLYRGLLRPGDIDLVERLVRQSGTWALVDGLAVHVAGGLVERHGELGEVLGRWAGDGDFWVRRAALLAELVPLRRGEGDFERFARHADRMLGEREFFVRKAIGWVLRDTARRRPQLVAGWLAPRTHRASGVTVREAVKHLPAEQQAALLDAYSRREPAAPPPDAAPPHS